MLIFKRVKFEIKFSLTEHDSNIRKILQKYKTLLLCTHANY